MRAISREYGPFVKFRNPIAPHAFIDDAGLAEELFVGNAAAFEKGRGTLRMSALLGGGLLTSNEPRHLAHRRIVQPAFHRARLDAYGDVIVDCTRRRIERWAPDSTIDVHRETMPLALEIIARALFGGELVTEMPTIERAMGDALAVLPFFLMPLAELLDDLPLAYVLRFKRARRELDRVVYTLMARHRTEAADRGDLLSLLMASQDEDGVAFTDVEIHDEAMTILLAGHETTANALAWTMYLLQRHPEIETRLHAHVCATIGDRDPTVRDVAQLTYVHAVVSETMRLYPPVWMTGRRARADTTIGPFDVRKGEAIMVSQFVTQRNPRYWERPDIFEPDRWLAGMPLEKFAYFPFGGGNRVCVGERFAWFELILAVATIVRRVQLERIDDAEISYESHITLRPKTAIRARVRRRSLGGAPRAPG